MTTAYCGKSNLLEHINFSTPFYALIRPIKPMIGRRKRGETEMKDAILVILTLIAVIIVARFVLKKVNTVVVFITSGIIILTVASLITHTSPLGKNTLGNPILDSFGFVTSAFTSTVSGVGAIIMAVTGYAAYMNHIGASGKLAYLAVKPLSKIHNQYLVLSGVFVIGMLLKLVITSQSALALLLLPTVFPIFMALGINRLTAASVLCLICIDWGPNDGSTIFSAGVAKLNVVSLFSNYQAYIVAAIIVVLAIVIPFYYKYVDKKSADNKTAEVAKTNEVADTNCPAYYALLPLLPLVLVFAGSWIKAIKLDVITANVIGLIVVFVIELIRRKDWREAPKDAVVILKAMGNSFANVVSIIIAASVFAEGIKNLGGISILARLLGNIQGASLLTVLLMTLITFGAAVLMGSGAASLYAFAPLVPGIASSIGVGTLSMIIPMELGAAIGRGMSPVAGATIAISGYAGVDTVSVVKRTSVPLVIALVVNIVASFFIL